eukprot:scaffold25800_cov162-Cylindrotheca_fusiformis.AAC.10
MVNEPTAAEQPAEGNTSKAASMTVESKKEASTEQESVPVDQEKGILQPTVGEQSDDNKTPNVTSITVETKEEASTEHASAPAVQEKGLLQPTVADDKTPNASMKVETSEEPSTAQTSVPVDQEKGFVQAQTPKHANKKEDIKGQDQQKITPDRGEPKPEHIKNPTAENDRDELRHEHSQHPTTEKSESKYEHTQNPTMGYHPSTDNGGFHPPRQYEGRPLGGNGAFQPHERRHLPPHGHSERAYYSRPPMQVSPGNGATADHHHRNYPNYPPVRGGPPRMEAGYAIPPPPSRNAGAYYDQRVYSEYGPGRHPSYDVPRGQYSHPGPPPPNYPPPAYNRFPPEVRDASKGWGPHPPPYPPHPPATHYQVERPPAQSYHTEPHPGNGNFSRSVSTSFDRSVKSRDPRHEQKPMRTAALSQGEIPASTSMASDDVSWKQLKQVHSVDDIGASKPNETEQEPASTSSSLTNSPTEGSARQNAAKQAKEISDAVTKAAVANPSSLDSLASVSSAQRPIETAKNEARASPASLEGSLDLMKCSSGSSGLLHLPTQQQALEAELLVHKKRGREEERRDGEEIRDAPSGEQAPLLKRVRMDESTIDEKAKKKTSPLSITCSPSAMKTRVSDPKSRRVDYHASPQLMEASYEKGPQFTYSLDSAPALPRDGPHHRRPSNPASLPPRPGSAASSTITGGAMHLDPRDPTNAMVPSISSWEIQGQDSFGNTSVGGGQVLASSFSFQDYPALSASESNLGGGVDHGGHGHPANTMHAAIESRNQSFEGGHYHGGGSFDHYGGGRPGPYHDGYKHHGHSGSFPPHAPSWGTAASGGSHPSTHPSTYQHHGPPPGHYGSYGGRNYPPPGAMMRNYSQESAPRASPPPGPHSMAGQGPPPGFQPPPEFAAPQNPHLTRRQPPPSVYIMTSSQNGSNSTGPKRGGGVFSWSKEDDMRLTEVMKKYKNPRDWEPIAKEHGGGKSAKECHERWIRYLKPGVRKGQWTDHEDAIVIEAVSTSSEQPFTRWSDLAQRLPGRVGKQIRDRWVNHLNPNINHLPFSREDDLLLWDGHKKLGKRWVEISTKFFHSSRSENHIKNRWYSASFKKFISNEFGPDAYLSAKGGKSKDDKKKKMSVEDPTIQAR